MIRLLALGLALAAAAPGAAAPGAAAPAPLEPRTIVEADGTRTLVHEILVAAPPAEVWRAISTAEGWTSWAVPLARAVEGEPALLETSYDPAAAPGGPATIRQLFVARIPGRMLAFRTVKAPAGFPDFDIYSKVVSIFELIPQSGGGTLVRLSGVGYPDSEAGRRLIAFFERGNAASLDMLRARFAEGPVDWAEKLAGKQEGGD
jgi:uncharacterized protein YndB with AHSA1/START domain